MLQKPKLACYGILKENTVVCKNSKKLQGTNSGRAKSQVKKTNAKDKKDTISSGIPKPIKQAAARTTNFGGVSKAPAFQRIWFQFGLPTVGKKPLLKQVKSKLIT